MANRADRIFKDNIFEILNSGNWDENPRPRYESDGQPAHTIFITQVFEKYYLEDNDFPITTLRPISIKLAIEELLVIYQEQSAELSVFENHGVKWWKPWDIGDGTIGQRYGATVKKYDLMNRLLNGLINDPYGRRHIISLWQEEDFKETEGLVPCAFQTLFSVRKNKDKLYLDMTLTQRSCDYLVAGHINKMQYVAFQMMVAKHCGYEVGNFAHLVQNLHIYDRHQEQAVELLGRTASKKNPVLKLNVSDGTNFYDIKASDFELVNYEPVKPQLKFELGV